MNSGYHREVAEHYEQYPYPQYPIFSLSRWKSLESVDVSLWGAKRSLRDIWIAGAGTIAPLMFARRNFRANIIASDLSFRTLKIASTRLRLFGMRNVRFKCEDIFQADYREAFDAVDAFGVIHHTVSPAATLEKLTHALRPGGVIRFMVYSRQGRAQIEGLRAEMIEEGSRDLDFAKKILSEKNIDKLGDLSNDPGIADALLNPIVHTFTREALDRLLADVPLLNVLKIQDSGNFIVFARKL